jgi:hypothetical protein
MSNELDDLFEKDAIDLKTLAPAALVSSAVGKAMPKAETPAEAERAMIDEYFDPVHDAEMRRIRMQAMLNDFLANDPIIADHPMEDVIEAFNQIAQLVPRASTQPAVMRGQLRKILQQQTAMEPFEANQLVEVEKGLKTVQEPEKLPLVELPEIEGKKE